MQLSDKTIAYGQQVTTALLELDAFYRKESDDMDGLVVLNMDTADEFRPDSFDSYETAHAAFTQLKSEAKELTEVDRRIYYDQLCHSKLAFIQWRDQGLTFESQLEHFLHVPAQPAAELELDELRGQMRTLLNQMGYHGDLTVQCAAWEERNRVPANEVSDVLQSLMQEAWDQTEALVLEIPAPKSDGMQVSTVSGVSYNARCDYLERTVELNIDPVLTLPGLRHLAVHECYPGHYLQFKLRETMYREGTAAADVLLSLVNTASSSVFEGIADTGLTMLSWHRSENDRLHALMNRYRAGIGTGAAWRLYASKWPEQQVRDWLHSQSLVGGEGWVANRMGFISAPARAVLIWSYWHGEKTVKPVWERIPPNHRTDFIRYLYGRMHSNDSVAMFEP